MSCAAALAQGTEWAHKAGKVSADGSITIKSLRAPGSSSTASRNPTSKAGGQTVDQRQNAATQPPVILKPGGADPYAKWSWEFKQQIPSYP